MRKIYFNIPWSTDKNIGTAYNNFMKLLPHDSDYACFIDGDAMFLHPFFGKQLEDVIRKYPECGIFTCHTNRIACQWQRLGDRTSNDVAQHREFANRLYEKHYDECAVVPKSNTHLLSGVVMLVRKSTWKKLGGFAEGLLGVDNELHAAADRKHEPVMIMRGVYVYHWYRGGRSHDIAHLVTDREFPRSERVKTIAGRMRPIVDSKSRVNRPEPKVKYQTDGGYRKEKRRRGPIKKIIYSAIMGHYDDPIKHEIPEGWEYRLFTNRKDLPGATYIESDLSDVKFARKIKVMPWLFFDFDVCIWVDGNTTFDPKKIDALCEHDFVISKHPLRDCLYEEAEAIVQYRKDSRVNMDRIIDRYRKENVPEHLGMVASHMILRKNTRENFAFCHRWWFEIKANSHRDQMSFNYVLWKHPIPIHYIKFKSIFWVTKIHRKSQTP